MFQHAFELLSAFDEIVALGYKENVNLAQIRTFTEMDSHDERVHDAMRKVFLRKLLFSFLTCKLFALDSRTRSQR